VGFVVFRERILYFDKTSKKSLLNPMNVSLDGCAIADLNEEHVKEKYANVNDVVCHISARVF